MIRHKQKNSSSISIPLGSFAIDENGEVRPLPTAEQEAYLMQTGLFEIVKEPVAMEPPVKKAAATAPIIQKAHKRGKRS